jgi:hypothetical protein
MVACQYKGDLFSLEVIFILHLLTYIHLAFSLPQIFSLMTQNLDRMDTSSQKNIT